MEISELLQQEDFCDYIQSFARLLGLNYGEVYDSVIDGDDVGKIVVEGFIRKKELGEI